MSLPQHNHVIQENPSKSHGSHINWAKRHAELREGLDEELWATWERKIPFDPFNPKRPTPPSPATEQDLLQQVTRYYEDEVMKGLLSKDALTTPPGEEAVEQQQLKLLRKNPKGFLHVFDSFFLTGPAGISHLDQLALLAQNHDDGVRKLHNFAQRLANELYALALAGNACAANHLVKLATTLAEMVYNGVSIAPQTFAPIARKVPVWPIRYHPNRARQCPNTTELQKLYVGGQLKFADVVDPSFSLAKDCDKLLCSLFQHIFYFRQALAPTGSPNTRTVGLPEWCDTKTGRRPVLSSITAPARESMPPESRETQSPTKAEGWATGVSPAPSRCVNSKLIPSWVRTYSR